MDGGRVSLFTFGSLEVFGHDGNTPWHCLLHHVPVKLLLCNLCCVHEHFDIPGAWLLFPSSPLLTCILQHTSMKNQR